MERKKKVLGVSRGILAVVKWWAIVISKSTPELRMLEWWKADQLRIVSVERNREKFLAAVSRKIMLKCDRVFVLCLVRWVLLVILSNQ